MSLAVEADQEYALVNPRSGETVRTLSARKVFKSMVTLAWKNGGSLGTIVADAARLQQVVGNLLANAVKFTPPGGCVSLEAERGPAELMIRVSDTGIGMDPEFLPHAFERFRQANTSTTRTHGGLGLGLSIVQTIVELHGGRIEAFSDGVDQGATFVVTLPINAG